jgi:HAD superfamily hydrolase (TIGR01509 family)
MLKAIIFDMDGVLVDSEQIKYKAIRMAFKELFNADLPENDINWIGKDEITNTKYFMDMFNLKEDNSKVIRKKRDNYNLLLMAGEVKPIMGSISFLKMITDNGLKTALLTNSIKEDVDGIINCFNLGKHFNFILSREDVRAPKPNPEGYLLALEKLKLKSEECIAIEDSPSGIKAAKSAGIRCVGITTTHEKSKLAEADMIIDSFSELIHNIRKLN